MANLIKLSDMPIKERFDMWDVAMQRLAKMHSNANITSSVRTNIRFERIFGFDSTFEIQLVYWNTLFPKKTG